MFCLRFCLLVCFLVVLFLFALEFVLGNLTVCQLGRVCSERLGVRGLPHSYFFVFTGAHKRLCYGLLLLSCVPQDCQRYHLCGVLIVSMWDRPLGFTSGACWEPSSPFPSLPFLPSSNSLSSKPKVSSMGGRILDIRYIKGGKFSVWELVSERLPCEGAGLRERKS